MNNLSELIKEHIRINGPLSFKDFMDQALYNPDHGYYSSGRAEIGRDGDFYTSPSVHPVFGKVISNLAVKAFDTLGTEDFSIVELGAGKGYLALDILDSLKSQSPTIYNNLKYKIIEISEESTESEKILLQKHSDKIEWFRGISDLSGSSLNGMVISNEFFDALPFYRLKQVNGKLREIFVSLEKDELVEIYKKPGEQFKEYLNRNCINLVDDQEIEVCLAAGDIFNEITALLSSGFILTIDYGYLADELYSEKRMKGTFRCFYRHSLNSDPYINIGSQDITADINFSDLIYQGVKKGLHKIKYINQGQFLVDWGILAILEQYSDKEHQGDRMAIKNLMMPELMGSRFKVLIQSKNIGSEDLKEFYKEGELQLIKSTL